MKKKLKVCLIGCGHFSARHIEHWQKNPYTEIYSVVGKSDANKVKKAQKQSGAEKCYMDYREALKDDVDIVDIITPHHTHTEICLAACEAKKHILCEKPLAVTVKETEVICAAAERNGVKIGVNTCMRQHKWIKALVDRGRIGEPTFFSGERHGFLSDDFFKAWSPWSWTKQHKFGGGSMLTNGIHFIDFLLWIMNSKVRETFCVGSNNIFKTGFPDADVDDTSIAIIKLESGAVGNITVSWKTGELMTPNFRISGTKGSIVGDLNKVTIQKHGSKRKTCVKAPKNEKNLTDMFVDWILKDKPFPATARDSIETSKVLEKAHYMNL